MSEEKSIEREMVEAAIGSWPSTGCPTSGYLAHALRIVGVGVDDLYGNGGLNRAKALARARANGLDFVDKASNDVATNER